MRHATVPCSTTRCVSLLQKLKITIKNQAFPQRKFLREHNYKDMAISPNSITMQKRILAPSCKVMPLLELTTTANQFIATAKATQHENQLARQWA